MNLNDRKQSRDTQKPGLRRIGSIAKPHGLHGDFFLFAESDLTDWMMSLDSLFVVLENEIVAWKVIRWRQSGNRLVLKLEPLADRTAVETHQGLELFVKEEDAQVARGQDFFFNSDLIGLDVYRLEDKTCMPQLSMGKVTDIQEFPAYNQLEIKKTDGSSFLLPFVKDLVPEVDLPGGRIWAKIPCGLEDLDED